MPAEIVDKQRGILRIVDRRNDPPGRGAINRERFVRRFKKEIKRAVDESFKDRLIKDVGKSGKITIPGRGLEEPFIHHDGVTGRREFVHPGNKEYLPGDTIPRPDGSGSGSGDDGAGQGEQRDNFSFVLSREEFLALFFDDLELPNLVKNDIANATDWRTHRAGYSPSGPSQNLDARRTIMMSKKRKIALGYGEIERQIDELVEKLSAVPLDEQDAVRAEIAELLERRRRIPYLEPIDQRFRTFVKRPEPSARAVMICLMDVSGSMDEEKKDLAKRFFTLLYLFLERKYGQVEVVFVRHTDQAEEVDEKTFFYDQKSGGTLILPALQLIKKIIDARYTGGGWNVYLAQASDGDCFGEDAKHSGAYVKQTLLPMLRYFAYVEIPGSKSSRRSDLWAAYAEINDVAFAQRVVHSRGDIWPVFKELFSRKEAVV